MIEPRLLYLRCLDKKQYAVMDVELGYVGIYDGILDAFTAQCRIRAFFEAPEGLHPSVAAWFR